jgi:glycosyltransferase involved in cell wall biosynthesis
MMPDRLSAAFVITDAVSFNTLTRGQLEYLDANGFELTLFCGGDASEIEKLRARNVGRVIEMPFRRKPHPVLDVLALARLLGVFWRSRFDVVVSSTPKAMLLGSLASRLSGQKCTVALVRGRVYENMTGLKRQLFLLLDRIAFWSADRIVFISKSLQEVYEVDGLGAQKKADIVGFGSSNGVDGETFRPAASDADFAAIRARLGFTPDDKVVVIAGRLTRDKGIYDVLEVIDAFAGAPGIKWAFVGAVEDKIIHQKVIALADAGVSHVTHTQHLEEWFQAADLHLFLTHREGFGNVAVEAAAAGTPTFAYRTVGTVDSVMDGVTGQLFPLQNTQAVVSALQAWLAAGAVVGFDPERARAAVLERFEQNQVWRDYAAYLRSRAHDRADR